MSPQRVSRMIEILATVIFVLAWLHALGIFDPYFQSFPK